MADWSKNKRFSAETYFYLEYHKLHGKSISFSGFSFLCSEGQSATKAAFQTGYWARESKRVWETPNKPKRQMGTHLLCLLPTQNKGKDGKGMEKKRTIKDGQIVVKNPLYQELPTHEVTIQSGRTFYRFTGSYDGSRSLPHKVLRLMGHSPIDEKDEER